MNSKYRLFDKIIDIELVETSGKVLRIKCPRTGMKPRIQLSGSMFANTIQDGTLKITNFYPPKPLNSDNQDGAVYSWLRLFAGYADGAMTTLEGQSFIAYTEAPGPDSVSVITFFTGPMDVWMQTPINSNWKDGTSLNTVVADLARILMARTTLKISPKSYISDSIKVGKNGLSSSGTCEDLVAKIKKAYGVTIYPEGLNLIACDEYLGKTDEYTLDYVTSIRKTGAGYTIIAPWIPGIRQNDMIILDAKYYTVENYGGIGVSFNQRFQVISINFEFSTVDDINSMTILCVGERKVTDPARKVDPK